MRHNMRKIFLLIAVILTINVSGQERLFVNLPKDSVVILDAKAQQFEFVPGEILIRYKDEVVVSNLKAVGIAQTGIESIDKIYQRYKVNKSERLFPQEQKLKSKVMLHGFNGQDFEQPSLHNIYKIKIEQEATIFDAIIELQQDSNVIYAEPNFIFSITDDKPVSPVLTEKDLKDYHISTLENATPNPEPAAPAPSYTPNDPLYSQQWYIPAVHANEIWDTITNDSTQVIAILDSGVDWLHPDLQNKMWINPGEIPNNGIDDDADGYIDDVRGWDWINHDNNPTDDNSHGTHVAGIAAAQQNNGIGIAGVSKKARIMALKVFQSSGIGDAATITQGIIYAKNKGATVINMSFGSSARSLTMEAALSSAYATCVLVAASGNNGSDIGDCSGGPFFPAALSYVLGVTAPDGSFSNSDCTGPVYSLSPELYNYEMKAPGTNILSTIPNGNYRVYQGTSMAAPVVSGCIAMYKSLFPSQSQELMWTKLIQTTSTYLNIHAAMNYSPTPKIWFVSRTLVDTISGGDGDGRVDAGETIQLWFKIRNTGGQADSVRVGIKFGEFEDTTTAQILTSKAYVGSLSPYASMTDQYNPLKIHISSNVANARDLVFKAYSWYKNSPDSIFQDVILNVENGQQLTGMHSDTVILTADKLWLINGSFKLTTQGVMIIRPGAHLIINTQLANDGKVIAHGKADSIIYISGKLITGPDATGILDFRHVFLTLNSNGQILVPNQQGIIDSSTITFTGARGFHGGNMTIRNCWLKDWYVQQPLYSGGSNALLYKCNLDNFANPYGSTSWIFMASWKINHCTFSHYNRLNEFTGSAAHPVFQYGNNFLASYKNQMYYAQGGFYERIPGQYWGTNDSLKIEQKLYDFLDNASLAEIIFYPRLNKPSDSTNAVVWKILVNGKDAQDEVPDPVGVGPQKFEVYFNKPMNPAFTPQVSFGVRYPYSQTAVNDSGHWSSDHKIYTCYKNVQLYTGDGINGLRVAGARDTDGWEIPIEDSRFEFLIQAAGSASVDFIAQAGIGKVYLEWNNSGINDLLGFNMYRFKNITDTTYTQPVMINTSLITDTTYTDFTVTPGQHYWYYYKVINTDFSSSDSSHFAGAIPYSALPGDVNGDGAVNVLDVTAIIGYMLNQNPQPFLFDAADVNNDHTINILDVIGVVNIITGKKKSVSNIIGTDPVAAHIKLEDDGIILQNDGQISSMQFELAGEGLENIKLAEPPGGFELAYGIVKGKLLGILYTSENRPIPAGTIELVRIDGQKSQLKWGSILAGDREGNIVPVLKDESALQPAEKLYFQAYPNPFKQSVTINFQLPEDSKVEIKIFNTQGKLVNVLLNSEMKEGLHWVDWNGASLTNRMLPSGIYFCKLDGQTKSGSSFNKEIKIIYLK